VTVDEMDLVRQLNETAPLRSEAYRQARAALREAMIASAATEAPEPTVTPGSVPAGGPSPRVLTGRGFRAGRRPRTLGTLGKAGIGAGIGLVAAAVAVALVATSAHGPVAPARTAAKAPAAASPLVSLAALIKSGGGVLPGDASLVIRTQTITGIGTTVSYNLYADNGAYYGGGDPASLRKAVTHHQDESAGIEAREVAAARYAAAGNLTKAREQMVNASPNSFGLGLSPAQQQALWLKSIKAAAPVYQAKGVPLPTKRPAGQKLQDDIDSYVWNNSVDALSAGAGNVQVRAGVLRLLSTIQAVTVAHSTAGGQPALTLTAGPALFGDEEKEVLTVNAKTGMPITADFPSGKLPHSVQTFKVSRVTVAGIAAGKF
jgi:hypothetical protein